MLGIQHIEEVLGRAYVQAVAGRAGVNIYLPGHDYGVDGVFRAVKTFQGRQTDPGYSLDYQLKSSTQWIGKETEIVFDLEVKTYNDLIRRGRDPRSSPCVLLLMCLPPDPEGWLQLDEEALVLRKCCYWKCVQGEESDHRQTVRIQISRADIFTPGALGKLLDQARSGRL